PARLGRERAQAAGPGVRAPVMSPRRSGEGVQRASERRLPARCGVPVDDASADRSIEGADRFANTGLRIRRLPGEGGAGCLERGTDGAPRSAVSLTTLLALLHPLDGGLGVGHDRVPPLSSDWRDRQRYRPPFGGSRSFVP